MRGPGEKLLLVCFVTFVLASTIPDEELERGFLASRCEAPSPAIRGREPQRALAVVDDEAIIQKVSAICLQVFRGLYFLSAMIDQVINARPVDLPFVRYNVAGDVTYLFLA
jgi:hypothetical protein